MKTQLLVSALLAVGCGAPVKLSDALATELNALAAPNGAGGSTVVLEVTFAGCDHVGPGVSATFNGQPMTRVRDSQKPFPIAGAPRCEPLRFVIDAEPVATQKFEVSDDSGRLLLDTRWLFNYPNLRLEQATPPLALSPAMTLTGTLDVPVPPEAMTADAFAAFVLDGDVSGLNPVWNTKTTRLGNQISLTIPQSTSATSRVQGRLILGALTWAPIVDTCTGPSVCTVSPVIAASRIFPGTFTP